jgi:hypothetical protein
MLCAVLNIPQPPTSCSIYNETIGSAVADVSVSSMMQAAREAVAQNEGDYASHITACFDGTWQKHGHTSLNGIISATSVDRGKVLDTERMSTFCFVFYANPASQHKCKKNHQGASAGMGGAGVLSIFNHSVHTRGIGICNTNYLGDGDSKSYQRVVAGKPYDPSIAVTKLEYTGHIQKRTGDSRGL